MLHVGLPWVYSVLWTLSRLVPTWRVLNGWCLGFELNVSCRTVVGGVAYSKKSSSTSTIWTVRFTWTPTP